MKISTPEEGEVVGEPDGSSDAENSEEAKTPAPLDKPGKEHAGKSRKEADEARRKHVKLTEQARVMLARFSIKDGTSRGRKK